MDSMTEMNFLSIHEALQQMQDGTLSPQALTEACSRQIERLNPKLNAFLTVMAETALERTRRADEELARGIDRGPLHGIPVAVKDLRVYEEKNKRYGVVPGAYELQIGSSSSDIKLKAQITVTS